MLVLTVAKGPDRGKVFQLRGVSRLVIGRNSPDLKLNDIMISRYHARLKLEDGKWSVRDMGSRNGTKLNGETLLKPTVLKKGDHIITGYTEFEVSFAPDPVDSPKHAVTAPVTAAPVDEPQGAASSAEINAESEDASAGAASSGNLSLHREEEPPAAVAHAAPPVAAAEEVETKKVDEPSASVPELTPPPQVAALAPAPEAPAPEAPAPVPTPQASEEIIPTIEVPAAPLHEVPMALEAAPAAPVAEQEADAAPLEAPPPIEPAAPVIHVKSETVPEAAPAAPPVIEMAPAVEEQPAAPLGERASSDWMSAIESQLVVAQGQGWDETIDDEEDDFVLALNEDVDDLDEDQRVMLYRDEDEHWADDVQLDDEELIQHLKEDGPEALLANLAPKEDPPRNIASPDGKSSKIAAKTKRSRKR